MFMMQNITEKGVSLVFRASEGRGPQIFPRGQVPRTPIFSRYTRTLPPKGWDLATPLDTMLNTNMEKLESVLYSAALAVTGAWRGTSREKLYNELGWESLNLRRWSRRIVMFYKIVNNVTPEYTRHPISKRTNI